MKSFRKLRWVIAAAALAAAIVASQASSGTAAASTIKVGNITAVAGLGGTFAGFQAGVKAYFAYANAHGGINGTQVDLIAIDDAGDPGKNAAAARTLVAQNKVLAIVGEATIADAASQKYLQSKGVPVVGGWAASSAWHKPATNMFVSLEGPNIPYCPLWSSDQAKAKGSKSIAFIDQAFPAAIQDADCRAAAARYQGLKVAGKRIDVSPSEVDYRPTVQQAMKDGADAMYFSTGVDGMLKGTQAGEQLGFKGLYIATQTNSNLVNGLQSAGLLDKLSGRMISAAFSLLPSDPNKYSQELARFKAGIAKYQAAYKDDVTAVSGWAAGRMFADALKAAGPNQAAITKWLAKQSHYTFGGLQGPMDYTGGSKPNPCVTQLELQGGKFVRPKKAVKAPGFNCGVLINPKTGKAYK
jgi:branched-chain amino acid transport system substrate-binding protein